MSEANEWKFVTSKEQNTPQYSGNAKPNHIENSGDAIEWTASEYMAHDKSANWFMILGLGGLLTAVAVYFLSGGDIFSTVAIVVVAIVLAVFAGRKPSTLHYAIDEHGIHIDQKSYSFDLFRSFSIVDEGQVHSVSIAPQKRFMPGLSLYLDPEQSAMIIDLLASYLPLEQRAEDRVERLLKKIRF